MFYYVNELQAFRLFQSLFFQVQMVNHCESHLIFKDI